MSSFDVVCGFRLLPTLSDFPPIRTNPIVVVVAVIVVVDVAVRGNAKIYNSQPILF